MPSPEWTHMITECRRIGDRVREVTRRSVELAYRQAALHHPETGGNPLLVHNWGNDRAKAAWSREAQRTRHALDYRDATFHRLWKAAIAAENR